MLDGIASVSDGVHKTFAELDARCARVGQTAAHVGDRLQATDQVKSLAQEACSLILCGRTLPYRARPATAWLDALSDVVMLVCGRSKLSPVLYFYRCLLILVCLHDG